MVPIGDKNVIDRSLPLNEDSGFGGHGRRVHQNLVFADMKEQAVEVEFLLL